LQPSDLSDCDKRSQAQRKARPHGIGKIFLIEMGMERSTIAAEGTIKAGLHKTPTTESVRQLFDARRR
jgi:hypothetical protein